MYKIEEIKNTIICGDTLTELKKFPDESIDMVCTSPPYFGLRDYGTATWESGDKNCDHQVGRNTRKGNAWMKSKLTEGTYGDEAIKNGERCPKCGAIRIDQQLGLEKTLDEYLEKMLAITAELKRVLKKTGTMWWNHGDSYGGSTGTGSEQSNPGKQTAYRPAPTNTKKAGGVPVLTTPSKSLSLQAHRLAIRMVDEQGWILRNTIIWHKPNCMPSSVKDRFTVDFEPVFFFTKSKKYWFEPQYEPQEQSSIERARYSIGLSDKQLNSDKTKINYINPKTQEETRKKILSGVGRNKRTVWRISTQPFPEAHFAVFPEALVITPIKAGCPEFICEKCGVAREKIVEKTTPPDEVYTGTTRPDDRLLGASQKGGKAGSGQKYQNWKNENPDKFLGYTDCGCGAPFRPGVVLDSFAGAGTSLVVALKLKRSYIGIELNPEYIKIAEQRLADIHPSLF